MPNHAPVITSNGGNVLASIKIFENNTAVATIQAKDPDKGDKLTYSIFGGPDAGKFHINPVSGALSFITAPDFEAPTDANGNNIYDVVIKVSDGKLFDVQAIAVSVKDIVEAVANRPPTITSDGGGNTATVNTAENTTAVTTVVATDPDARTTLTYSIAGGVDAGKFTIDAVSGALRFVTAPDFEAPTDAGANNVYDVVVKASDGKLVDTQALAVAVKDVVEVAPNRPPVITSNGGNDTAAVSTAENTTAVTTVSASDPDPNTTLAYFIAGGADAGKFAIDPTSGKLSFITAPNFEAPGSAAGTNVYAVTVKASDGSASDSQLLTVTVNDVPENTAPVITSNGGGDTAAISIPENSTAVTIVTASDPDANTTLAYSIAGGADAGKFAIDPTSGKLSFITAPNFEAPGSAAGTNVYAVTVKASDGSAIDSQVLAVTVTDVVEAPANSAPVGVADSYIAAQDSPLTVPVALGLLANDTDAEHDPLTAALVKGPVHGALTLDANGSFSYVPATGYVGADSFTYRPNDGAADGSPVVVSMVVAKPGSTGPLSVLTTGDDVINGGPEDSMIRATAQTLNYGDQIDGGEGTDTVELLGAGSFNFSSITRFTGIERITLINDAGNAAVYLPNNASLTFTGSAYADTVYDFGSLATGATIDSGAGSDTIQIYGDLASGVSINGEDDNDTIEVGGNVASGVSINAGAGNDYVSLDGVIDGSALIDGGAGNDTLQIYRSIDLTSTQVPITNFESFYVGAGEATIKQALIDSASFGGYGTLKTTETTLDLSGKSFGNLAFISSNATGTTFTVTNATTGMHVYGGPGNDTLVANGFSFTPSQLTLLFAQGSIETVSDGNGNHSAPESGASVNLTTGNDVINGGPEDSVIRATAQTLNYGDQIDGGEGTDTVELLGAGSFNFSSITRFTGIERITLINDAGNAAVYLPNNASLTITGSAYADTVYDFGSLATGATIDSGAGSDTIQIYGDLASGVAINGEDDNDTIEVGGNVASGVSINAGAGNDYVSLDGVIDGSALIDGGAGNDTLQISRSIDLTSTQGPITNFESFYVGAGEATIKQALIDSASFGGYGTLKTTETTLDLSGKSFGNLAFISSNATGTTFTVTNATTGMHVYGGPGNDTLVANGFSFTPSQLTLLFAQGSIETVSDGNGNHSAPESGASVNLTTGNDVINGGPEDSVIRATAQTLNYGDQIDGGDGTDTVELLGAGSFNFSNITPFTGIERITLINDAGNAAVYLPNNASLTITGSAYADTVYDFGSLAAGATIDSGAGSDTIQIYGDLASGVAINGEDDNDTIEVGGNVASGVSINAGAGNDYVSLDGVIDGSALIDGGAGNDTLQISRSIDLTSTQVPITNFESFYVGAGEATINQALVNSASFGGYGTLKTTETTLDLSGKSFGNLAFISSNATGTTFTVTNATTGMHVYGGPGNDTLVANGFSFTPSQLTLLFAQGSIETVTDASGLHTSAAGHTYVFQASDPSGGQTITGFDGVDTPSAGGDVLDISQLLIAYDPAASANFIQLVESGGNTILTVDRDGAEPGFSFQQVALLQGVTGLDLNLLLQHGNIHAIA